MITALRAAVVLLIVWGWAAHATAQATDSFPIQNFAILDWGGSLFIEGEYQEKSDKRGTSSQRTDESDLWMQEGIELDGRGYVYHPNLIDWAASGRFGLTQQRIKIDDQDFDTDGDLLAYDLSALFLKRKPVSARVFASQSQDFRSRSFARHIKQDTTRYGAELFYRGPFPMALRVEHFERQEESGERDQDETTNLLTFRAADERNPDRITRFTYEHEDTDETVTFFPSVGAPVVSDLPDRRDEMELLNRYRFGPPELPHRLDGRVRWMNRRGSFNNDVFSVDQTLLMLHSDTFSTIYRGLYLSDETDTEKDETLAGEIGFDKSIYDSLDIRGRGVITDHQFIDGSERTIGGLLALDYGKNTPVGWYTAQLSGSLLHERDQSDSASRRIRDEPVTLSGIAPVTLSRPGASAASVVVTDLTNTITYVEGPAADYILTPLGAFLQIRRVAGGGIGDPETVLVDYTIAAAEDSKINTTSIRFAQRIDLGELPIALYMSLELIDESLVSGDDPGNLDREETSIFGVELDYEGLLVNVEHEIKEQRLSPSFTSNRVRARYVGELGTDAAISMGGGYEMLRYTDSRKFGFEPGRDFREIITANAHMTSRVKQNLLLRIGGDYTKTRGRENDELGRVFAALEWYYRDLSFSIEARHEIYTQERDEGDSTSIAFSLRRTF